LNEQIKQNRYIENQDFSLFIYNSNLWSIPLPSVKDFFGPEESFKVKIM